MIKLSIFYLFDETRPFDIDYYMNSHAPMVRGLMGSALKGAEIDHGVSAREPGTNPTYVAVAHLFFEAVDDLKSAYGANADKIKADIPNYTDIEPIYQISTVRHANAPKVG